MCQNTFTVYGCKHFVNQLILCDKFEKGERNTHCSDVPPATTYNKKPGSECPMCHKLVPDHLDWTSVSGFSEVKQIKEPEDQFMAKEPEVSKLTIFTVSKLVKNIYFCFVGRLSGCISMSAAEA
ncbi:no significant blast hit, mycelia-enriched transcript [Histoplasma capsulatum]|uniref:No significant blast hit, mycelia-enriched transcript n=1 Tax=Ajellomyces capsulatus TaxID=5037 RepID=A0A8A1M5I0_AJECA|nr:no significant blast hit, mycelia-enriched transcript [Histoplasma capsulatum]